MEAQRAWAIELATRDPKSFATFVGTQPVILPSGQIALADPAKGDLTPAQKELCARMGVKEDDYKAQLAKKEAA